MDAAWRIVYADVPPEMRARPARTSRILHLYTKCFFATMPVPGLNILQSFEEMHTLLRYS